jgi:hypothetical protein
MGLDITAYGHLTLYPVHEPDHQGEVTDSPFCYNEDHIQVYPLDRQDFPVQAADLEAGRCYKSPAKRVLWGLDEATEDLVAFRAGSYSGYNVWREQLCEAALGVAPEEVWHNPELYRDRPFYYFINFADNEGQIGPRVSALLAAQFASERAAIEDALTEETLESREYFLSRYDLWQKAFEVASHDGLVDFH